jgi:hypothetical protein
LRDGSARAATALRRVLVRCVPCTCLTNPAYTVSCVGISTDSSFEADILQRAPGCEVWGYDFSVSGVRRRRLLRCIGLTGSQFGPQITAGLQSRAHFHKWGLGGEESRGQASNPPMYTLEMLMDTNGTRCTCPLLTNISLTYAGHNFIDLLKIDIEGSEFSALSYFLKSLPEGAPLPFGQLQIEIHAWDEMGKFANFLRWWELLEEYGLRPFWTEPNLVYVNLLHAKPDLTEVGIRYPMQWPALLLTHPTVLFYQYSGSASTAFRLDGRL